MNRIELRNIALLMGMPIAIGTAAWLVGDCWLRIPKLATLAATIIVCFVAGRLLGKAS